MIKLVDLKLLRAMENGIKVVPQPFEEVAETLGMTGAEVLREIGEMLQDGTIRSFGAVVDHRTLGLVVNAMVAWEIVEDDVERVGLKFAEMPMVSHCYERATVPGKWRHNLFTMVHCSCEEDLNSFITRGLEITSNADFLVLRTVREFKKVGVRF